MKDFASNGPLAFYVDLKDDFFSQSIQSHDSQAHTAGSQRSQRPVV